eukprot:4846441-Ditylum_brightwellii.AAC.1
MGKQEWKILAITKCGASTKRTVNNNNKNKTNNAKHNIDGIQVTMIASFVNNGEEEECLRGTKLHNKKWDHKKNPFQYAV